MTIAPAARRDHTAIWTGTEMIVWGGYNNNFLNTGARYNPLAGTWMPTATAGAPAARADHTTVWTGTQMIVWGGDSISGDLNSGARYDPLTDSWTSTSTTNAPAPRHYHTAVWNGSEMIVWGGYDYTNYLNTGGRYDPATDNWTPTDVNGAPEARFFHTAVWTGTEMIVWGGASTSGPSKSGGRYDPFTDTWASTNMSNAPVERDGHTAIWSGTEMIVWGGSVAISYANTGGRYDPSTDNWTPTNTTNAPPASADHTAVWTGTEMIIWGGKGIGSNTLNSGGRYDPIGDSWTPMDAANAPTSRYLLTAIWTGTEMIIWSGYNGTFLNSGARYYPSTNTWTPTATTNAPVGRYLYTAVWTGIEMIAWGGRSTAVTSVNSGGRYNPSTDSWLPTEIANAPVGRFAHTGIWSGTEMIVWGGTDGNSYMNTGGRYNPSTNSWVPTDITNAPAKRYYHAAVWTGTEMIVWGGYDYVNYMNTGGRYNPSTDSWAPTDTINAPPARLHHTAVWTGTEMIVWGGFGGHNLASGGRYNPFNDSWMLISTTNAPAARYQHTAVWTGTHMIVWGGFGSDFLNSGGMYCANHQPTANDDIYTADKNLPLNVAVPGVLTNDTDADGDSLTAALDSEPASGSVILNLDGSLTYTPDAGFEGNDSFTYHASDGVRDSNVATVTITVINTAPIASDDNYSTNKNVPLDVNSPGVLANDTDLNADSLSAVLDSTTSNGTLVLNSDGSFTYTPNTGFAGIDSFTYHASDGTASSSVATVTITIINSPPVAADDNFATGKNVPLNVAAPGVLANDTDADPDPLSAVLDTSTTNGTLTLSSDGSFTYTPNTGFAGADSFTYHVSDGTAGSNIAIVTITINNSAPVAVDDNYSTDKNVPLNVATPGVLANDTDPDADSLSAVLDSTTTNGILTLNDDGSFTYTPNTDFVGTDNFTYHVNDEAAGSSIATVNITINQTCLFCDDFNDDTLDPDWTYIKPSWSESGGSLIATPSAKKGIAVATPVFTGCRVCVVEARLQTAGGANNTLWLLSWYVDKKDTLELLMKQQSNKWILKQRAGGSVVARAKAVKQIDPNTSYVARIVYDGTTYQVFIDDFVTPVMTLRPQAAVPVGTVGFQVKNTIGVFDYITVN